MPMDGSFVDLAGDLERIRNHAEAVQKVEERSRARAQTMMQELEHAMKTNCSGLATLQLAQHNAQVQKASVVQVERNHDVTRHMCQQLHFVGATRV